MATMAFQADLHDDTAAWWQRSIPRQWHCLPQHGPQPPPAASSAAACWTGGKDSMLALLRAQEAGLQVQLLVTFAPPGKRFYAHDRRLIELQVRALHLRHAFLDISVADGSYRQAYVAALERLRRDEGVAVVISGDMALVGSMQVNWMRDCAEAAGLRMLCPLWGADRRSVLGDCLQRDMRVVVSCARGPWLTPAWVGRMLGAAAVEELQSLHSTTGMDTCGENGEYHTMVLDCQQFSGGIVLAGCRPAELPCAAGQVAGGSQCWYLEFDSTELLVRGD